MDIQDRERIHHPHFYTKATHAGQGPDPSTGAVAKPIYLNTIYQARDIFEDEVETRNQNSDTNPTHEAFESCVAALEYCKYGICFPSGTSVVKSLLSLVKKGDHIICLDDIYGGTAETIQTLAAKKYAIDVTFADLSNPEALQAAIRPNTKLLFLETPTNPTLKVLDIKSICTVAKEHNILTITDNTLMTPYLCNPINHGADIVWHSASKYIGGHSDLILGILCTNNPILHKKLHQNRHLQGLLPCPFNCYLALRGVKTLALRVERHCWNALQIANFLSNHRHVAEVRYPGLDSHDGHDVAGKQCRGKGGCGVVAFYLTSDDVGATREVLEAVRVFVNAGSHGGTESSITTPCLTTHCGVGKQERVSRGITDGMIRLSVGIEDVEDLIGDLERALEVLD